MWKEGTIGVPTGNGKYTVVHYTAKIYDEPSDFGINGGRISKLTLSRTASLYTTTTEVLTWTARQKKLKLHLQFF